jgi:hypothetical protein
VPLAESTVTPFDERTRLSFQAQPVGAAYRGLTQPPTEARATQGIASPGDETGSLQTAGVGVLKLYARSSGSRRGRRLAPGTYLLRLTVTRDDSQRTIDSARLQITR